MFEEDAKRALDEQLAGDATGWSLRRLLGWLLTEQHRIKSADELLNGLTSRLLAEGAPVDRIRLSTRTLHPLIVAWGASWEAGTEATLWTGTYQVLLTEAYIGSPSEYVAIHRQALHLALAEIDENDHSLLQDLKAEGFTDYLALPIPVSGGGIWFGSFATRHADGFSSNDVAKLQLLSLAMGPMLEAMNMRRVASVVLDTYIGHHAGARVLSGHIKRGDHERLSTAIWYSDLRGFAHLNEIVAPDDLVDLLNTYFGCVAAALTARGGQILQFIGDAVLAIIPTPDGVPVKSACEAAFDAALDALNSIAVTNAMRVRHHVPEIRFGIGLHVGDVIYGNVGSEERLGFNVVGPAVNLTARLETLTKEVGVPLLISQHFAAQIDRPVTDVGRYRLKGIEAPQAVFTATELQPAPPSVS